MLALLSNCFLNPESIATVSIRAGSKKFFAPNIIRHNIPQNTPIAPISPDLPFWFRIRSMNITTNSAVIEKSMPVKSIGISWLNSEPKAEPIIQYRWSSSPMMNLAFGSSTFFGTTVIDEFTE